MFDSTLKGGFTKLYWGDFSLQLSWELLLCLGLMGEFVHDTGFAWDLVDDLYSQRSFHDDFWSTEGGIDAFNPLVMLF